jgi:hypothetical protein
MRIVMFILIAVLLLAACSGNRFSAYRAIEDLKQVDWVPGSYDKAVCDPLTRVVFAMDRSTHEVHIYRGGKRINTIGGLGFDRTSFQRLSDIGVDTDGSLLALDSVQKLLRKFSPEGGVVAEISLSGLHQPELFCVSADGELFVFDAATQEIVCISAFDAGELYRFGRFQLKQPSSISCSRDYIAVYSGALNSTDVFYLLGQYKESIPDQVVFDNFNNPLSPEKTPALVLAGKAALLTFNRDAVCALYGDGIRVFAIQYRKGE